MYFRVSSYARAAALALFMLPLAAISAHANSIGPICGSCQGSVYTLTNLVQVADLDTTDGLADTWRIALSIDTTNYTGSGIRIDEVAVKVSSAVDKVTLLQAPGGLGVWS